MPTGRNDKFYVINTMYLYRNCNFTELLTLHLSGGVSLKTDNFIHIKPLITGTVK